MAGGLRPGGAVIAARLAILVSCLAASQVAPSPAAAQVLDAPDSTFRITVQADVPVLLVAAGFAGWPALVDAGIAWRAPELRDRASVNAFDRIATRQWSPAAAKASDGILYGAVAGAFVAVAVENLADRRSWQRLLVQGTIVAESVLVAAGLTQGVKVAVRRPRPAFFNPAAPRSARTGPDANLSFFSGHTSLVASALTSLAVVEWWDDPGSPLAWTATVAAAAAIPAVAVLRVAAGRHYPSDVLTGAAVGVASGVLVPLLHRVRPSLGAREVRIEPVALPGGAGAAAGFAW